MENIVRTKNINKEAILCALEENNINEEVILKTWREIVEIESYTHNKKAVENVCAYVEGRLKDLGFETRTIEFDKAGPTLVGEMGQGDPSEGVILTGHMDTVHKDDFIKDFPFRVEEGKVYGPGVLDMKGGINIIFYVVEMLKSLGYNKPIKVLISGDEEHGHGKSGSGSVMAEEAKGYKYALNFETGLITNDIVVARKGMMHCAIRTTGLSAHAGANFDDGISAIKEMSHKILEIQELNGKFGPTTLNVGTITGGTVVNAVPENCEIKLDIRYVDNSVLPAVKEALESIVNKNYVEGTKSDLIIENTFPAFPNSLNGKLFEKAREVSSKLGFGEPKGAKIGGASDAAFITQAGVPCLCALGAKGEWNHSNREYALVDSAMERILFITNLIFELEGMEL
ncbi:glutamate carboxypeptidase [Dethiosulfatibacter aminovorans DSM 17477]|uniref:Glutamate carboxypeptidase n=1 Tax=Dethiosulfatibacter aminovorans DSM 17477 TaxID=1121476 RepID=A0A1M6BZH8_9FIRM|nr:M20 family metallopeptidase [Dethiosulfatibacter aminovorans]SHI54229.1 glutamate carboxypeptidase [Dethiosulfatibacter aminovorans DSM 17477]